MTKRDAKIVAATLGWVGIAGGLINGVTRMATGEFSHSLGVLLLVVALAGAPFLYIWLRREYDEIKLPPGKSPETK